MRRMGDFQSGPVATRPPKTIILTVISVNCQACHPFSIIAAFHSSEVSSTSSCDRHTCESLLWDPPKGERIANGSPIEALVGASRLNDRDGGNRLPRQVDSEHASSIR